MAQTAETAWLAPAGPRDVVVRGRVVRGDRRGRLLGFPTANVAYDDAAGIAATDLADGVYAGWLRRCDTADRWPAAISVGTNPTFVGTRARRIESHVIDQTDLELYGVEVEVTFVELLREMCAFDSVTALVEQMHQDVRRARVRLIEE